MCPTTRTCGMVKLSVLWGHSSRARRLLCLHGKIFRWNVTRCPSCRAHCTSSERQKEAWPGLTGPPAVPDALEELRFRVTVICSIYGLLTPTGAEEGRPVRGCAREASYPSQGSVPWRVLSRKNCSLTENTRRARRAHSGHPSAHPGLARCNAHSPCNTYASGESCEAMLWRAD